MARFGPLPAARSVQSLLGPLSIHLFGSHYLPSSSSMPLDHYAGTHSHIDPHPRQPQWTHILLRPIALWYTLLLLVVELGDVESQGVEHRRN